MMTTLSMATYLTTLFDIGDHICLTKSVYSNHTKPLADLMALGLDDTSEFVVINAFRPGTTRARRNINTFRNFIMEFEDNAKGVPIDRQRQVVEDLGLPFSTQVYSGSKSMHFVISLETPLATRDEWERYSRWLYSIMEPHRVDPACKNVDRFTRVGGGYRCRKDARQEIVDLRGRVSNDTFLAWLAQYPEPAAPLGRATAGNTAHHVSLFGEEYDENFRGKITKETMKFATTGGTPGRRHSQLFKAACDVRDQRYPLKDAKDLLLTKLREQYKITNREGDMWRHENTVTDAYENYSANLPRF